MGWCPSPKPTEFDGSEPPSSDERMLTPEAPGSDDRNDNTRAVRHRNPERFHDSGSPDPEKNKKNIMKRTPQPTLTQSKLTFLLQTPSQKPNDGQKNATGMEATKIVDLETIEMDTTPSGPTAAASSHPAPAPSTTEFLLKAMKENTDQIIKLFNTSIGELAGKGEATAECKGIIVRLEERVSALESERGRARSEAPEQVHLCEQYQIARRSARIWPVTGSSEEDLWGGAGEFLHGPLGISEEDLCQEDIEDVRQPRGAPPAGVIHDEVVITIKDKRKRDLVMASSANLSGRVGQDGKPTAGTLLEIPPELMGTFRLLSRFGTWFRARHGEGTRRHIKFNDFTGSLFANVKLPGDAAWTRVTPGMTRDDLEKSMSEERNQARLAPKLVLGPRERLAIPQAVVRQSGGMRSGPPMQSEPAGKRPR